MAEWQRRLGVRVDRVFIQRMKNNLGNCNPVSHDIRLNTDRAKKLRECMGYILVHELVYLLEPTHNAHFVFLMSQFLPGWEH